MTSLFDITEYSKDTTFKKAVYFKSTVGTHLLRIIPEGNVKIWSHYVNRTYIKCLGKDDCPVCQRNVKIRAEYPKDFRNHGYAGVSQRFCVNVLDRTSAIICSNCQEEVTPGVSGRYPQACPKCGTILTALRPAPLNKIKMLSGGIELFALLDGYHTSQLDADGEPLGLGNFDIQLFCQAGADGKVKPTPIPMPHLNDKIEYNPEDLFDCSKSVMDLTAKEINDLERGVQLRDIFSARRANQTTPVKEDDSNYEPTDADQIVKDLFSL